jgi:hypothetical protein
VNGELLSDLRKVRSSDEADDSLLAESLEGLEDLGASREAGGGEGAVDVCQRANTRRRVAKGLVGGSGSVY